MSRKQIPPSTTDRVLLDCRRRCCICFGINRATSLANGQVAHLDKNNANSSFDNLAYLCLDHHDEYDSRTSQRKNFTIGEVKAFRAELIQALQEAFAQPVRFGQARTARIDEFAGTYILLDDGVISAEITLVALPKSPGEGRRYHVSGLAILDRNRELGAHIGTIDVIAEVINKTVHLDHGQSFDRPSYSTLTFAGDGHMQLEEVNVFGEYGWGVSFMGGYGRVPPTIND